MCYQVLNFEFMHGCTSEVYWIIQHKSVIFSECVAKVCLVLYRVASGLSDRSECFTLHTLAYLFIPTQLWLLLEAFSHVAITVQRLHSRESCVLTTFC